MDRPLRIVFCGTPDFAVPALEGLIAAGHEIVAVLTQPPRAGGRGQKPRPGPVQRLAEARGLPVMVPERLKGNREVLDRLRSLRPDLGVVAAYGLILPPEMLAIPAHGFLNVHASLLPRWRGAAPIQRALLAGDAETGVTIMKMDAGLDTGPILAQEATPITADDDAGRLHDRLAEMGAELLVGVIPDYVAGRLAPRPQPEAGATYAPKIAKREAVIDWSRPADAIARQVRAFSPYPGARTRFAGTPLRILAATPLADDLADEADAPPGTVVQTDPLLVATGAGVLRIHRLQRAGRKPLDAEAFLRGFPMTPGTRFESLAEEGLAE